MIVIWQCSENPTHRGWRNEANPEECGRRGTCDVCLAMSSFEQEMPVAGEVEFAPPRPR